MKKPTGRDSDQFNLRMPDGMRDTLKQEAEKNGRSLNAEIIVRLQKTLDEDDEDANYVTTTKSYPPVTIPLKDLMERLTSLDEKLSELTKRPGKAGDTDLDN